MIKSIIVNENRVTEQFSAKLVPTSLKQRLRSDGTYEEIPLGEPNDPDYTALVSHLPISTLEGEMPGVRAVGRIPVSNRERMEKQNFNHVAEGKQSLDDIIAQLSNENLAHLLGDSQISE